ncbi:DUF6538 domain-containing protein [Paracoccus sp. ME4]|uniref:DUF6538 domain-containing protein n=1 Tax=Paracoccus sp. ME4 TaxID=3138066 RepID=UPI00398BBACF
MARLSHLMRRGASYSARIRVPLDLIEVIGKKELVRALGTTEEAEAKRRLWPVIAGWHREFDDLRARRALVPSDREAATWSRYSDTLARDDQRRGQLPSEAEIDAITEQAIQRVHDEKIDTDDPLAMLDLAVDVQVAK